MMMRIERLSKDELLSHTAEIISSQESRINDLIQQRQVLIAIAAIVVIVSVLG